MNKAQETHRLLPIQIQVCYVYIMLRTVIVWNERGKLMLDREKASHADGTCALFSYRIYVIICLS